MRISRPFRAALTGAGLLVLVSATASAQTTPPAGAAGPGQGMAGMPPPQVVMGPPAPVPPQVAMLRPTDDEVASINTAMRDWIGRDQSPAQSLLQKYAPLLMLQPPRPNVAATFTQTVQRMGPRHEGFVETAKAGNIDLLLAGDSITDWWVQNDDNKAVFQKYFGGIRTANFAIAGDTTQGVLWGLRNGEGQGFQPKAVMLMIGTNNTGVNTGPEIAEGIGAVVLELRRDFPEAKILLLGVFPRSVPGNAVRDKIAEVNRLVARLDDQQHVFFMDIGAKFLDASGVFLPGTFRTDNLHPMAPGYEIWGAAVKDALATLLR
jgi:lysophospholipase L1-like esterase